METQESGEFPARAIGAKLKDARKQARMTQEAVGGALGVKGSARHVYVGKLERGELPGVSLRMVVRYLQACKAPIGKFMMELVQSGAFGEEEADVVRGFTSQKLRVETSNEEKRARGRLKYQQRWERELHDAQAVAALWKQVLPVILPMFPAGKFYSPVPYLNGVREYYRVWKLATRQAKGSDPTPMVNFAFDQVEKMGLAARLIPAVVRKVREIVFERLVAGG